MRRLEIDGEIMMREETSRQSQGDILMSVGKRKTVSNNGQAQSRAVKLLEVEGS